MTDRHSGYLVTLTDDISEDHAAYIMTALRMVSGVASVTPVVADPIHESIGAMRRDTAWAEELLAVVTRMQGPP